MFSCVSLNSKDSLEEFLPLYQCKDQKKRTMLKKERDIVRYLKSLGIQMKTDPLSKFGQNLKFQVVQQNSSNEEIIIDNHQRSNQDEFDISNNPILKRVSKKLIRTYSFEKNDQQFTSPDIDEQTLGSSNIEL